MFDPQRMTPEIFISQIAETVIGGVKKALSDQPVKMYDVYRQTPTGPVTQSTSLPQILAELTDTLKINNDLMRYLIGLQTQVGQVTEGLKIELEENRKLATKITKRNKRKIVEEDEDEE